MINNKIFNPESIAIIGGSEDIHKPGGKLLKNILDRGFEGCLYVVNPKYKFVQGIKSFNNLKELPNIDLAIIAIPAKNCFETIRILTEEKNTKAFIIISAGFSEEGKEGAKLENEIVSFVKKNNACLIGPNCTGVLTNTYAGIFTLPIPKLSSQGCDLISGSGATAVFIMESAITKGLTFSNVITVGNSAQNGVEDILKYMDENFDPIKSPKIKLLYIEKIKDPDMLLLHSSSLIRKGCKIAAIKSGGSTAGSRAAFSHTGALASSDLAVEALFRKAGVVRCSGREELTTIAGVLMHKKIQGKRIAIITHAGGPAVMLTDALSDGGLEIPPIERKENLDLLLKLHPGASISNPIDLLATGTAEQLGMVIDYCDKEFNHIDAIVVIFGTTGLSEVFDAYQILIEKMESSNIPIFAVLPSITTAKREVEYFLNKNHINFPDEVQLGRAITKVFNTPNPSEPILTYADIDISLIRKTIKEIKPGHIAPAEIQRLFNIVGIPIVNEGVAKTKEELLLKAQEIGYPMVLKVLGPVHKTDVGGVVLNIKSEDHLIADFERLMKIKNSVGVIIQPMFSGIELYLGAKYEPTFGHLIFCGLGGIFVEIIHDVSSGLAPLTIEEALSMIRSLKSYEMIKGARGQKGIDENRFADIIVRLSILLRHAIEIKELDINPLLGKEDQIIAVDARILIQK